MFLKYPFGVFKFFVVHMMMINLFSLCMILWDKKTCKNSTTNLGVFSKIFGWHGIQNYLNIKNYFLQIFNIVQYEIHK